MAEPPLTETTYPYLSVDARYEYVRQDGRIVSQGVLIVAGVRADGHREILAVSVADTESEATYNHLFGELKARGLSGVQLVTSDAHKGLKAAIDRHFKGASWQPGPSEQHSRNLRGDAGTGTADGRIGGSLLGTDASERGTATGRRDRGLPRLPRILPGTSRSHPHDEIKRRTRVVPGALWAVWADFPTRRACLRLVTALCMEKLEEWVSGRRYLAMGERPAPVHE